MKPFLIFGGFAENFRNILKKQLFAIIFNILNVLPDHFGILWIFNSDFVLISWYSRFFDTYFDLIFFGFLFFGFPSNECFFDNIKVNMAILHEPHQRNSKNVTRGYHHLNFLIFQRNFFLLININWSRAAPINCPTNRLGKKVFLHRADSLIFARTFIYVM